MSNDLLIKNLSKALSFAMKYYPNPLGKGVYPEEMAQEKAFIDKVRSQYERKNNAKK